MLKFQLVNETHITQNTFVNDTELFIENTDRVDKIKEVIEFEREHFC